MRNTDGHAPARFVRSAADRSAQTPPGDRKPHRIAPRKTTVGRPGIPPAPSVARAPQLVSDGVGTPLGIRLELHRDPCRNSCRDDSSLRYSRADRLIQAHAISAAASAMSERGEVPVAPKPP